MSNSSGSNLAPCLRGISVAFSTMHALAIRMVGLALRGSDDGWHMGSIALRLVCVWVHATIPIDKLTSPYIHMY